MYVLLCFELSLFYYFYFHRSKERNLHKVCVIHCICKLFISLDVYCPATGLLNVKVQKSQKETYEVVDNSKITAE